MEKFIFKTFPTFGPFVPLEIFCKDKYKDYYIRGQVLQIYQDINYYLIMFVLVNNKYLKKIIKHHTCGVNNYPIFGLFVGKTKKEFFDIQNAYILEKAKKIKKPTFGVEIEIPIPTPMRPGGGVIFKHIPMPRTQRELTKKVVEIYKEDTYPPITISKKGMNIIENTYLDDAIKANKEIIILSMNLDRTKPDSSLVPNNNEIFHSIFYLLAYSFADNKFFNQDTPYRIREFFKYIFDTLYYHFDYDYLSKKEYYRILGNTGELGWKWIKEKTVSEKFLQSLNNFNKSISEREHPFTDFCYSFFDDLIDELITQKQVIQCPECKNFFPYKENKKYCSTKCKKRAENARDYKKHKDKRQTKSKKDTRELRAFYKEKGIKK